jgi:hypothetical protein
LIGVCFRRADEKQSGCVGAAKWTRTNLPTLSVPQRFSTLLREFPTFLTAFFTAEAERLVFFAS